MKRIFISGPITPRGRRDDCDRHPAVEYIFNIRDMILVANRLSQKGWAPFCPGLDFLNFLLSSSEEKLLELIWGIDLAWLSVSDAVLMMPGWEKSQGARMEHLRAEELGLPIYLSEEEIPDLNHKEKP
jgi:hypothetical protein